MWSPFDGEGNQTHGGVIPDNVVRAANGDIYIYANGNYYEGPKRGVDGNGGSAYPNTYGGKRTGGVIKSRNAFGPGSFETVMKVPSASGVCTSVWLYNWFGDNNNHEIDIELHGTAFRPDGTLINDTNLSSVLCSSWLTEEMVTNRNAPVGKSLADGQFHSFRIDWHTGDDPRVEYHVDGVLVMTIRENVPTNKMYFNIGCWFPRDWCGQPDFETDVMVVRSFTYTPFEGESVTSYGTEALNGAPIVTGQPSEGNLLANGSFDKTRKQYVWQVSGSFENNLLNGTLLQVVTMDVGNVQYLLKLLGSGTVHVTVEYFAVNDETALGRTQFDVTLGTDAITFTPPEGCTRLKITISCDSAATLTQATLNVH